MSAQITVQDFAQTFSVSSMQDIAEAMRQIYNIDAAINTNLDNDVIDNQAIDFFTREDDVIMMRAQGSACCQPGYCFSASQFIVNQNVPIKRDLVPFTDQLMLMVRELQGNQRFRAYLQKYFHFLNDLAEDPRQILYDNGSENRTILEQFMFQDYAKAHRVQQSVQNIVDFDNSSEVWGPRKLIGFSLLYAVRFFSTCLLYILSYQEMSQFCLFQTYATDEDGGQTQQIATHHFDYLEREEVALQSDQHECLLVSYFESIVKFLQFDEQFKPNVSPMIYQLIIEVVMGIHPLLVNYETTFGWNLAVSNPCDKIRKMCCGIMQKQHQLVYQGLYFFQNSAYSSNQDDLLPAIAIKYQEIWQTFLDYEKSDKLKELVKNILKHAERESSDYLYAVSREFGINPDEGEYQELFQEYTHKMSQDDPNTVLYLVNSFVQDFIPFRTRYLISIMRYIQFVFSADQMLKMKATDKEISSARSALSNCTRNYFSNINSYVSNYISLLQKDIGIDYSQLNAILFINAITALCQCIEEWSGCQEGENMFSNTLIGFKSNEAFMQQLADMLGSIVIMSQTKYNQIIELRKVEVQLLGQQYNALYEVIQNQVPELQQLFLPLAAALPPPNPTLDGYFYNLNQDFDLFNWCIQQENLIVKPLRRSDNLFIVQEAELPSTASVTTADKLEKLIQYTCFILPCSASSQKSVAMNAIPGYRNRECTYVIPLRHVEPADSYYLVYLAKIKSFQRIIDASQCAPSAMYKISNFLLYNSQLQPITKKFLASYVASPVVSLQLAEGTSDLIVEEISTSNVIIDMCILFLCNKTFDLSNITLQQRYQSVIQAIECNAIDCVKLWVTYRNNYEKLNVFDKKIIAGDGSAEDFDQSILKRFLLKYQENRNVKKCLELLDVGNSSGEKGRLLTFLAAGTESPIDSTYITQTMHYGFKLNLNVEKVIIISKQADLPYTKEQGVTIMVPAATLEKVAKLFFLNLKRLQDKVGDLQEYTLSYNKGFIKVNAGATVSSMAPIGFITAEVAKDALEIKLLESQAIVLVRKLEELKYEYAISTFSLLAGDGMCKFCTNRDAESPLVMLNLGQFEEQMLVFASQQVKDEVARKMVETLEKNKGRKSTPDLVNNIAEHYLSQNSKSVLLLQKLLLNKDRLLNGIAIYTNDLYFE